MVIAHKNHKTKQKQYLNDHLINTAKMAGEYGKSLDQENVSYILGLLHDVGKADKKFQDMIENDTSDKVNHSSAGSKYLLSLYKGLLNKYKSESEYIKEYVQTLIYVIQAHHGLFDILGYNSNNEIISNIQKRINYDIDNSAYKYKEEVLPFIEELNKIVYKKTSKSIEDFLVAGYEEYKNILIKLDALEKNEESFFYRHIIIRLYLSILKNADVYDTINAYEDILSRRSKDEKKSSLKQYLDNIENLYLSFGKPKTALNKVRNIISEEVLKRSLSDTTGVYRLDLPTGERVIIVMGARFLVISRVSGTFNIYNSCIA